MQLDNFSFFSKTSASTNDLIRKYKDINGYAIATDYQENGRGQYSRKFETKPGQAILTSLIFNSYKASDNYPYLIAGIVRNVLSEYINVLITIKLPNDLMINNQKLAGILIENDIIDQNYLIIGIGINIYSAPEVDQQVTYLSKYVNQLLNKSEITQKIIEDIRKKVAI